MTPVNFPANISTTNGEGKGACRRANGHWGQPQYPCGVAAGRLRGLRLGADPAPRAVGALRPAVYADQPPGRRAAGLPRVLPASWSEHDSPKVAISILKHIARRFSCWKTPILHLLPQGAVLTSELTDLCCGIHRIFLVRIQHACVSIMSNFATLRRPSPSTRGGCHLRCLGSCLPSLYSLTCELVASQGDRCTMGDREQTVTIWLRQR